MRLLIAEDDAKLLQSLVHIFEGAKYTVDGVTVLRTLREKHIATPALFLTARTGVYQRTERPDAGAHPLHRPVISVPVRTVG